MDARAAGDRIEQLLDDIHAAVSAPAWAGVEELVRVLTDLYGAGLARTIELLAGEDRAAVERLAADDLVGSLLLLHGLHPDSLPARVRRAVDAVAPAVRSRGGEVELEEVDEERATARVSLRAGQGVGAAAEQIAAMLSAAVPDVSFAVTTEALAVPVHFGRKPVAR
ncbi:MAG TPA: hypothetical protein VFA84_08710 [Acidimicrobiales bacterium]|nr:hypothetical protein [Acidimicrobiales bacterium]